MGPGQARPGRPVPPAASMPGHAGEGRGFRLSAPFSRLASVTRCGGAWERAVEGPARRHDLTCLRLSLQQEEAQGEEKEKGRGCGRAT